MKIIEFERGIDCQSIRDRNQLLDIVIKVSELFLSGEYTERKTRKELCGHGPFIKVDDGARIFIYENNKFFSFAFPFHLDLEQKQLSYNSMTINYAILSVLKIVLQDITDDYGMINIADRLIDEQKVLEKNDIDYSDILLYYLLNYEIGYIRFDIDPETNKKYLMQNRSDVHPVNHFDINYTNKATYKIGLRDEISMEEFVDCLDSNTDCWFVSSQLKKNKK